MDWSARQCSVVAERAEASGSRAGDQSVSQCVRTLVGAPRASVHSSSGFIKAVFYLSHKTVLVDWSGFRRNFKVTNFTVNIEYFFKWFFIVRQQVGV